MTMTKSILALSTILISDSDQESHWPFRSFCVFPTKNCMESIHAEKAWRVCMKQAGSVNILNNVGSQLVRFHTAKETGVSVRKHVPKSFGISARLVDGVAKKLHVFFFGLEFGEVTGGSVRAFFELCFLLSTES